jgi:hypothetical protein
MKRQRDTASGSSLVALAAKSNPGRSCHTFVMTANGLVNASDGTWWRDCGRRKRWYKFWLARQCLEQACVPDDVIHLIRPTLFAPFLATVQVLWSPASTSDDDDGSDDYTPSPATLECHLYTVTLRTLLVAHMDHWRTFIRLTVDQADFEFTVQRDVRTSNSDRTLLICRRNYVTYWRGTAQNTLGVQDDHLDWTLYDYLLMLSEQESFELTIGGRYYAPHGSASVNPNK